MALHTHKYKKKIKINKKKKFALLVTAGHDHPAIVSLIYHVRDKHLLMLRREMSRDVYCLGRLWYIDRNIFRCHKQVSPCLFMSCRSFHLFHERQTTHMRYQVSFDLGWACLQNFHVFYFIHTIACKDCSHGHYISHTWNLYMGKQERDERTRNLTLIRIVIWQLF